MTEEKQTRVYLSLVPFTLSLFPCLRYEKLKPDNEILLRFEVPFKKNEADKEQIDGQCDTRIAFYFLPGFFHTAAPVDIVEDHYSMLITLFQKEIEIA